MKSSSKLPKNLFIETYEFCESNPNMEEIGDIAESFVKKFDVDKLSGLTFDNAKTLIRDIIDIQIKNIHLRNYFNKSPKFRAQHWICMINFLGQTRPVPTKFFG